MTGGDQVRKDGTAVTSLNQADTFQSGPHGGYLTSTHRCRECHAVHRAAGKFKLLRSDTRFEACDWCHGTGAGSGYNIQMDNDDNYTTEYNVGHTMGFGVSTGKWKAPDEPTRPIRQTTGRVVSPALTATARTLTRRAYLASITTANRSVSDFCTDCHDGNAGKHTVQAPLFSEDRALRNSAVTSGSDENTANARANYDLAYGHDVQPRH